MTLPQALAYAREHRPLIRSALLALSASRLDARVPRMQWVPRLGATAQLLGATDNESTSTYVTVSVAPIQRIGATPAYAPTWAPSAATIAGVSLRQEVFDFGRIAAQTAVADALADEAAAGAQGTTLDVLLAVEEAYASVLAARQVLDATDEALKHAITHRDYADAGVKRELRPQIDLTRAQAEVSAMEARRIRARGALAQARATLAAAIGSNAGEIDAAPLDIDQSPAPTLAEALKMAAQRNPALLAALARVRASSATTSAISHEIAPNLTAIAGLFGSAGGTPASSGARPYGDGWLPDLQNWYAGLALEWNIVDATVLARKEAAGVRERQALAARDEIALVLDVETRRAWIDLQVALEALAPLGQAVESARANLAQAEARFRAALGNIIELSDAQTTLIDSELELAVGRFNVARARAALGRALGGTAQEASRAGESAR